MSDLTPATDRRVEERRKSELAAIIDLVTAVHSDIKAFDTRLTLHISADTHQLADAIASLMGKAFPEGDPDGHRRHHELVIKKAEAQAAFWEKMKFELLRWGLIGFLGWAAVALWRSLLLGAAK